MRRAHPSFGVVGEDLEALPASLVPLTQATLVLRRAAARDPENYPAHYDLGRRLVAKTGARGDLAAAVARVRALRK